MSKNEIKKPIAAAVGVALAGALSAGSVLAAENPFGLQPLDSGYMQVADSHVEGKCGGKMKSEDEGKCGSKMKSEDEGKCGSKMKSEDEGKCGGKMKSEDQGMKATDKTMPEGKCGEGKCGGKK